MPNPQTATERFLRHGVAGGWEAKGQYRNLVLDEKSIIEQLARWYGSWEKALLDPALWQAAGRSLGWPPALSDGEPQGSEWLQRWHGLLDWLAAHPGDVEGYLSQIIGGKENV